MRLLWNLLAAFGLIVVGVLVFNKITGRSAVDAVMSRVYWVMYAESISESASAEKSNCEGLEVFEHGNKNNSPHTGTPRYLCIRNSVDDLGADKYRFSMIISSACAIEGDWAFYRHVNKDARHGVKYLRSGNCYSKFSAFGWNDQVRSIRKCGQDGLKCRF